MKNKLLDYASFQPESLAFSGAWAGHLPFAAWLMSEITPKVFVELGTYSGNSYFSFCQAVREDMRLVKCYAVDTWVGDEHSGYYTDEIFDYVNARNKKLYSGFSTLLRMTFDEAVGSFADNSIDLLHIDGLHTYEAVKHDFETWLPKLSANAVVLFHDINVRENSFGVWKFWEELQVRYPFNLEFLHSHGLGVLTLTAKSNECCLPWLRDNSERKIIKKYFTALGTRQIERFDSGELTRILTERNEEIIILETAAIKRDEYISDLDRKISEQAGKISEQTSKISEQTSKISDLTVNYEKRIELLITSKSMRITQPLRTIGRLLRGEIYPFNYHGFKTVYSRGRNAFRYIKDGDYKGLCRRIKTLISDSGAVVSPNFSNRSNIENQWGILATKHTLFVATLIAECLEKHGFHVEIVSEQLREFPLDWYIVICPQMFDHLPPGEKRIVFQMEQSVSSRWFTDNYIQTLKNSSAVLEYSLINLNFLANKGVIFPHVYYLPVGATFNYAKLLPSQQKNCDILFYGDSKSSSRRREMLDALKEHFNVRIVSEVFGQQMQKIIKQARLVVNLHYYDNALLEMPRIQECLSLGIPVISESAQDQDEYPELAGAVCFFEQGSINEMIEAARKVLKSQPLVKQIHNSTILSQQRFSFMFDRFLVAMGFLPPSYISNMTLPSNSFNKYVALSLPETIARRRAFEVERPLDCAVFSGLRLHPGWLGCGLSYQVLAKNALQHGLKTLTVMEDDVILPADFENKMNVVDEFLEMRSGQWDIFSGLIASLHCKAKILSVEDYKGMTFVTIDKMTSMVFNVYSQKVLKLLLAWDPEDLGVENNTIDRYLENQTDLRVVVVLPFLVGHCEDAESTLWGFQNSTYRDMIARSEKTLLQMVASL